MRSTIVYLHGILITYRTEDTETKFEFPIGILEVFQ